MPKGKAKKNNPDLYQDSPESQEPNMAPQAMAHRRGGKHRVKSADLTNSKYDEFSYAEVLELAKDRGIYRKDMRKKEMAMANKQYDADEESCERAAIAEQQKREQEQRRIQQEKNDEKQAAIRARHHRAMQKERQRAEGQEVSDDSLDEDDIDAEHNRLIDGDEYKQENVGQILSDESWDSTSTESSAQSTTQTIEPDCRLRLYEWPEWPHQEHVPSKNYETSSGSDTASDPASYNWQPVKVSYAPLKVITTYSKQKLFLPGLTYPPGVQPDFVPILSQHTRNAARNGVLLGVLRKATIERASDWTDHTQIEADTATMFLNLPARNKTKNLSETYDKWYMENRKLLRVKARGDGVSANRAQRHSQRFRNKAKKVAEVYEACQYRPLAVCYVPSYLDYGNKRHKGRVEGQDGYRSLDNLFYIRFPGCDVPHYYFWARRHEWSDPTVQNPDWDATEPQQTSSAPSVCIQASSNPGSSDDQRLEDHTHSKPASSPSESWTRVKIPNATLPAPRPSTGRFETALKVVEHQLYATGLAATLAHYHKRWIASDKHSAWQDFSRLLPALYPGGNLPLVPPNVSAPHEHSLAFKIATIDIRAPDEPTPLTTFQGDEAWTCDDDVYWDLIRVDTTIPTSPDALTSRNLQAHLQHSAEEDAEPTALYRRASILPNRHVSARLRTDNNDLAIWHSQISPSFGPWPVPRVPSQPGFNEWESEGSRASWKLLNPRLTNPDDEVTVCCPFCGIYWTWWREEGRVDHLWSHSGGKMAELQTRRLQQEQSSQFVPPVMTRTVDGRVLPIRLAEYDGNSDGDVDTPVVVRMRRDSYLPRRRSGSTYSSSDPEPRARKRRKIADPTYRNALVSEDDEEFVRIALEYPAKKRRKIADPTYRDIEKASSSSDEVVVSKMVRKRKRVIVDDFVVKEEQVYVDAYTAASQALRMEMKRSREVDDEEREREEGEERAAKRVKSGSISQPEEEQGNWEWCIVM